MHKQTNLVKNEEEVDKLRQASHISSRLHTLGMGQRLIGKTEVDLADYFSKLKSTAKEISWAYPVIVGSGSRSTALHAKPTKKNFKDGELVLVDMGVEFMGYCSDITRTWPVGTEFSKEQKTIYKIVLKAQKEIIKKASPGMTLESLHEIGKKHLLEGLLSKGVIKSKDIGKYFPHKTSHWIGKDVHDKCPYQYADKSSIVLSPNMCFTVEPGLYFQNTGSKYEGIGVRIEDVVLITETGCEVLSNVPKEVDEIESIRSISL